MSYSQNKKRKYRKRLAKGLCPVCKTPLNTKTWQCPKGDTEINWSISPPKVKDLKE